MFDDLSTQKYLTNITPPMYETTDTCINQGTLLQ